MSPVKKFAGPVRVPNRPPVRPAPPPQAEDDDEDDERLIRNAEKPGWTDFVEAPKYDAMQVALLRVIPSAQPGLTQAEIFARVLRHLPATLFPGGAKAQWWAKTVYLDLEAKKVLSRTAEGTPVRWFRTAPVTIVEPAPLSTFGDDEDLGARKRPHRHERKAPAAAAPAAKPRGKGKPKRSGPPRDEIVVPKRAPKRPKGPQD